MLRATAFLLLVFTAAIPTVAQGNSITGKIITSTGTPVPSATVTLTSHSTSRQRSTTTDAQGAFVFVLVEPGTYDLSCSKQGFLNTQSSIEVVAGEAKASLVLQPASSTVRQSIGSRSVSDLPLNGRSASDAATLEPGVATARTQNSGQAQRGFGTQMTISGSRPRQNDYLLDGISVNDYANGPPGSALGVNLGVDAVEQFSVLSSNYPARYGRSSGGIVSASTRSGTKEFHGSAYEFLRNSALDARNYFDVQKPPFRRNQFGATLGGPLWKGHTYIFGDYEGLRSSLGVTQVDTVPSAAARAGNLSTGHVVVDPTVLKFVNAFYPLPNGPLLGAGDTGIYTFSGQQVTPENYFTTKVDQQLTQQDMLSGTYMFDSGTVRQPDELNDKRAGYDSHRQGFTLRETRTFSPHVVNTALFGINRVVAVTGLTFPVGNAAAADPTYGTVPALNAPQVSVPGLTTFSGGLGTPSIFNFHWTSLQVYDDVTWTRKKHTITAGANLERIRDNSLSISDTGGLFSFNSLTDFLTNQPFTVTAAIPSAASERGIRQTVFGTYIQDDWRWRPTLTLNLGLRYEMATVPTEVHGWLTALRSLTDAAPHLGDPLFANPTLHNFEPRIGFSWDPLGNGKTSISSGFGIFDVLPLPYLIETNELFSAPYFKLASASNLPQGTFPGGAFAVLAASPNTYRQGYFDPNPRRNYVMQWNLTIQRDLAKDLNAMVAYVGSRGVHQPFRVEDADIVMPTITPRGYLWPTPVGSGTRLNLNAGRIAAGFWTGDSYYDALEAQVKKRFSGASIQASYTWGKSIDTSSGSLVGDEYANSISSPLWFVPRLNRGLSDFNISQTLSVNYTWEIPGVNSSWHPLAWASRGWQLGGVLTASSGVPFTPGIAGDALGLNSTDPNVDVPNLVGGPGCGSLINPGNPVNYIKTQCFAMPNPATLRGDVGRNTLIGPGLLDFDFSVFKNNYIKSISDHFNIQFRAEFFNIFNRANFAPPLDNRNIFDSTGTPVANAGLITSTQTPSRQIQFAVKVIW
jgi:hypothetical protein